MRIGQIMTRDVEVTAPGDTLRSAARLMADLDVGVLPVAADGQLVGMITDRDITVRGVATGQAPERCTVGEIMSTELRYCLEDDTVEEVAERMGALQVRRLPVLDRDMRLVGIVALGDLATKGGRERTTAEALREISEPAGEPAPEEAAGVQPGAADGDDRGGRGRNREPGSSDLAADEAARGGGVGP